MAINVFLVSPVDFSLVTEVKFFCPGADGGLLVGHLHIIQAEESDKESTQTERSEDENDDEESEEEVRI